jgi:hypothetical protein
MENQPPLLKAPKTNWKYILIVVVLAIIVGGGILGYRKNIFKEITSLNKFPEIKKPEEVVKDEVTPLTPEEMIPTPEETSLLENQIENWPSYKEIIDEKEKWVGTDSCGNKEFEAVLMEAKKGSMKIFKLNNALDLVITPNYNNWTNEEFTNFNDNPTAICAVGGRYPRYAYSDKLLWVGSCGSGFEPDITSPIYKEWKEKQIRCEKASKVVKDFFNKKETADWKTYRNEEYGFEMKYPPMSLETNFSAEDGYIFKCGEQLGDSLRLASSLHFGPTIYDFTVYSNPQNLLPEDFFICKMNDIRLGSFDRGEIVSIEDVVLGDQKIKAQKIIWQQDITTILVPKRNVIIEIQGQPGVSDEGFSNTFSQIISTFKFLE